MQIDCHRIAHQTASKKISRMVNEGGYKLDNNKMREAVRFIHKMGSVPDDEVRKMMNDLTDESIRKEDEMRSARSRQLFEVLRRYASTAPQDRPAFSPTDLAINVVTEFRAELKKGKYDCLIRELEM